MAVERILLNGQKVTTLRELLRPKLKVVFVGLNPAPRSVECGHYYQGRHGVRFWERLFRFEVLPAMPRGKEDDFAFELGFGFADLIRRPTASSKDLTSFEKLAAVPDLAFRLSVTQDWPLIVFTYAEPCRLAGPVLSRAGYRFLKMPGPYAARELVERQMRELKVEMGER
jgi:TDG/mug DNA glycosylase family protein